MTKSSDARKKVKNPLKGGHVSSSFQGTLAINEKWEVFFVRGKEESKLQRTSSAKRFFDAFLVVSHDSKRGFVRPSVRRSVRPSETRIFRI